MPKRRTKDMERSDDEDGSDGEPDLVNVDFDFFDPRPIDYIALKRLLTQLFQGDAEAFHFHDLTDLILSQPLLGSTVKTDGIDSDPFAFLTVLNMNTHREHPSIQALATYLLAKSTSNPGAHKALQSLIGPEGLTSSKHVGLVLGERLINMPVQVIPPMYRMLLDEIQWAIEEKEPYMFENYIILSRLYRLTSSDVASMMEEIESTPSPSKKKKKSKKGNAQPAEEDFKAGTFSFHTEDDQIQQLTTWTIDYNFSKRRDREGSDSLGLDVAGRMMVVPAARLPQLVKLLQDEYPLPSN